MSPLKLKGCNKYETIEIINQKEDNSDVKTISIDDDNTYFFLKSVEI